MDTFKKLKQMRELFALIPCQKSPKDFDIAVEIGYHQYLGTPLTQKQLLLLGIASPATVRRHVKRLIKTGMLVKHLPPSDHRVVYFTLTDSAINYFKECLSQLKQLLLN